MSPLWPPTFCCLTRSVRKRVFNRLAGDRGTVTIDNAEAAARELGIRCSKNAIKKAPEELVSLPFSEARCIFE